MQPKERTGLWRFEPENDSYQKISDSQVDVSLADGGLLLHRNAEHKIAWVDRQSLEVTELPEFAHAAGPTGIPVPTFISPYTESFQLPYPRPHLIKVGRHLISSDRELMTPDGKKYPLGKSLPWRWPLLQRLGKGFITHYEPGRSTIWYVEPK